MSCRPYFQMHVNPCPAILLVAVVPYIWCPYKWKGNMTMPRFKFTFFKRNYYCDGPIDLIWLALAAVVLVPMVRHILWCIEDAAEIGSAIALLVVGMIFQPVGWVHGINLLPGFGGWES